MIRTYYFVFYKLYKVFESAPSRWWSEMKAAISMVFLEVCLITALLTYFVLLTGKYEGLLTNNITWGIVFLLTVPLNIYLFVFSDQWKDYVVAFNKMPSRKNNIGGWMVLGCILLIVSNFVYTIFLYYQT